MDDQFMLSGLRKPSPAFARNLGEKLSRLDAQPGQPGVNRRHAPCEFRAPSPPDGEGCRLGGDRSGDAERLHAAICASSRESLPGHVPRRQLRARPCRRTPRAGAAIQLQARGALHRRRADDQAARSATNADLDSRCQRGRRHHGSRAHVEASRRRAAGDPRQRRSPRAHDDQRRENPCAAGDVWHRRSFGTPTRPMARK